MSLVYLPEQVAASLGASSSDGAPLDTLNGTNTAKPLSGKGRKMASIRKCLSLGTYGNLTASRGVESWTSSLRDSRANPLALQENVPVLMTNVTCGPKHSGSLAKYDPDTHSWRTSPGLFPLDTLEPSSVDWPKSGTMRSGVCWGRTMSVRHTGESDYGYWPTPNQRDWRDTPGMKFEGINPDGSHRDRTDTLARRIYSGGTTTPQTYPTPNAFDATCGDLKGKEYTGENRHAMKLIQAVTYQTPTREDYRRRGPNSKQQGLPEQIHKMKFTTPCSDDTSHRKNKYGQGGTALSTQVQGQLNPDWVEWLMGWPIGLTDLKPLAMDKFRQWRSQHGKCSGGDYASSD